MVDEASVPIIYGAAKNPKAVSCTGGELAGHILAEAINSERDNPRSASLKTVLPRVSSRYQGSMNARPQDIKKIWHEYQPAAHLWAAKAHWDLSIASDEFVPLDSSVLAAFLALAETTRLMAEGIKHKNAREPFLPPNVAWRLPDSLSHLQLPRSDFL